jgi:hypothetical protein
MQQTCHGIMHHMAYSGAAAVNPFNNIDWQMFVTGCMRYTAQSMQARRTPAKVM